MLRVVGMLRALSRPPLSCRTVRRDRGGRRRAPTLTAILLGTLLPLPAFTADLPAGFVHLADIDPTIRQDMRYAGSDNFLGRPAAGYLAPECILTEAAATALSAVQKSVMAGGLSLIVFDCYRPARAVTDFAAWVKAGGPPDKRWYPRSKRGRLIAEGYIAAHSAHSRGSTVDLALVPADPSWLATPDPDCGADHSGTVDFGTGFDCLDQKSRTAFFPLAPEAIANRKTLVAAMQAQGFRNYAREWWHFSLNGEPFKQEFDFPVESRN
jgi:zinc D-Ala-D-Ala dipeptidase